MSASPRRVLILMSDTGGGHRAVAEALAEAFAREFPNQYAVTVLDAIKECAAFPFNHMPAWYLPVVTFSERGWGFLFHSSNNRLVARLALILTQLFFARGFRRFMREQSFDLIISVHPLLLTIPRRIAQTYSPRARFATVVADLVDTHRLWFDPQVDACFVPTEDAYTHARRRGVPAEKIFHAGLPVSLQFMDGRGAEMEKRALRARLGIAPEGATILLVGGGEGMGPVYAIARALDAARLPAQLVVIAGRNRKLYDRLTQTEWAMPVCAQGFVTNMPEWMRAANVIVTKAGPVTVSEALACGLPILLSGHLPGQEEGNVDFVVQHRVGAYCPTPEKIVATLREWLTPGNATLAQFAANARRAAKPDAAIEIVKRLDALLDERSDAKDAKRE